MKYRTTAVLKVLAATTLATALTVPAASAVNAAPAAHSAPRLTVLADMPSDENCPADTFCIRDAYGHYAHYREGANDVERQLQEPSDHQAGANWAWNRTGTSWCVYQRTNQHGDNKKYYAGQSDDSNFAFYSVGKPTWGDC
jgi:hypothetical protein